MKKFLSCLLVASMCFGVLAGCGSSEKPAEGEGEQTTTEGEGEASTDPIYFAWYGPMTGDSKQYGDTEKVAVELALEKINGEMGGLLGGRELIVDFYDDKNDAKEAVTIANKIVGEGKYVASIGGFGSTPSMAAAPIYEEAQIINYSPTASHADYSAIGDFIFRNTPTQSLETTAYADYVYNELGIKTVCILNVNDDWGNNIAKIFTERFEELGGQVLSTESYLPNQTTDFTPMISKAKTLNPEAFFPIAYYQDSANILKQADSLDFDVQMILSSSTLKQELLDLAGDLANGCFLMNCYTPDIDTERFKEVIGEYEARTGKAGDAFVMQTYDVVMQLAQAVEEAGTDDPVAVRDVLDGMTYECLAGEYTMNEIGDAVRPLQPIKVIDGAFVNISNGDPSKAE
ncbi:MAG: ABC transporter substrate-binding protein [Clostridiales bacterium]|nr:ABC transporter substrate-binding protein [Clostridiales bacterium]